jgi:cell division protein FtsI/penicillin-binding protein 2
MNFVRAGPAWSDRLVRTSRAGLAAAAVLLACGALAACTADDGPPPEEAADALAEQLSRGELDATLFDGRTGRKPQRAWARTTEGLRGATAEVTAGEVQEAEDGESATVPLTYAWDLPLTDETWTQEASARLVRVSPDDREPSWKVRLAPALFGVKAGERFDLTVDLPERAPILAAGGEAIVKDRPVVRFGVDKAQVDEAGWADAARTLAGIVDVDAASLVKRVEDAGEKAFVEAIVLREEEARRALGQVSGIDGIGAVQDAMPLAPTREFARPILGTVGPVTAEIVEESDGAYRAGDVAGLSGLQARYDQQLRGTAGVSVAAVEGDDRRTLFSTEAVPGDPLATTLVPRLQQAAEEILAPVGPPSALVAVRPSTGEILAAASGPGSAGYSTATVGQYAPGSTFKAVSSLALLRSGLTPDAAVDCPRSTVVDGKTFENYDDYPVGAIGRVTFAQAVANSCNTSMVDLRDRADDVAGAAASLGLGVDHDLGFPAYFGQVPEPESETSRAAAMIGQGQVLASPLVMAAVAASVQDGRTVVPYLLAEQTPDEAAGPGARLDEAQAIALHGLLRGVVTGGSGRGLADVPGPPVIAKTGTAEYGEPQDDGSLRTHAWMIAAQGDLAVAAFVEDGDSGSGTAGPLLEQLLRAAR